MSRLRPPLPRDVVTASQLALLAALRGGPAVYGALLRAGHSGNALRAALRTGLVTLDETRAPWQVTLTAKGRARARGDTPMTTSRALLAALVLPLVACGPAPAPVVAIPDGSGWCCNAEEGGGLCSRCAAPTQAAAWCAAFPPDAYYPDGTPGPDETRCYVGADTCEAMRARQLEAAPAHPPSACVEAD